MDSRRAIDFLQTWIQAFLKEHLTRSTLGIREAISIINRSYETLIESHRHILILVTNKYLRRLRDSADLQTTFEDLYSEALEGTRLAIQFYDLNARSSRKSGEIKLMTILIPSVE